MVCVIALHSLSKSKELCVSMKDLALVFEEVVKYSSHFKFDYVWQYLLFL